MINIKQEEFLKMIAQLEVNIIEGGIMFLLIENRTIKWKVASSKFDMEVFREGSNVSEAAIAVKAMKEMKTLTQRVPREMYGIRLYTVAVPLVDDNNNAIGAFSIVLPRLHPVAASFNSFAPILSELFPEGAYIYMSDLTKIAYVQPSSKFTVKNMEIGHLLTEADIAYKVINTGKPLTADVAQEIYGVPTYVATYPLFEEEDGKRVLVATLGVIVPKATANKLKNMSENLSNSLTAISKTVEHLAESATSINENEQILYNNINSVGNILIQINEATEFISSVASQSNMLGLNASIEAARAGNMGKGFSVVANEIRKLSVQSKEAVPKIKKLIDEINNKITEVDMKSKQSLQSSEEQAAATEEISASIQELSALTNELNNISKDL